MANPHQDQTATLLANGQVLVAGVFDASMVGLSTAELYDPTRASFAPAASLAAGRGNQTATLLNNGDVLIAGGYTCVPFGALSSAELYSPVTGALTPGRQLSALDVYSASFR